MGRRYYRIVSSRKGLLRKKISNDQVQLCTYMLIAAVDTLYFLFLTFYLLKNILKWDVATIALSHRVRGYCTGRAIDAVSLNFY